MYPGVLPFVRFNAGDGDVIVKKEDYVNCLDNCIFPLLDQHLNIKKNKETKHQPKKTHPTNKTQHRVISNIRY